MRILGARRFIRKISTNRDGSVAVEFALIAPYYLLMIYLIMEFGRLAYTVAQLNYTAQEATRYAVVRESEVTEDSLVSYSQSKMPFFGLNAANINVDIKDTATCAAEKDVSCVDVVISYVYKPMMPIDGASFTLTASSKGFVFF